MCCCRQPDDKKITLELRQERTRNQNSRSIEAGARQIKAHSRTQHQTHLFRCAGWFWHGGSSLKSEHRRQRRIVTSLNLQEKTNTHADRTKAEKPISKRTQTQRRAITAQTNKQKTHLFSRRWLFSESVSAEVVVESRLQALDHAAAVQTLVHQLVRACTEQNARQTTNRDNQVVSCKVRRSQQL